ncbi:MAG: BatA domain-containing protein [Planctomycetia bacterium]|nr:BatA domain-containing protein [Planctomycetia bacterium]
MSFLTASLFIGGLAAAIVPLLLHLLMRSRPRRLPFPALRFVRSTALSNERHFKLKGLLLMALRILTFVVLGLALARPVLTTSSQSGAGGSGFSGPVAAAVVIDTSPAMNYRKANTTRLSLAKRKAEDLLARLPKGSSIAILDSSLDGDSFQVDLLAAQQRLARLETSAVNRPLAASVLAGLRLLASSELPYRELYIVTDRRAQAWPDRLRASIQDAVNAAARTDGTGEGGLSSWLLDVAPDSPENTSIAQTGLAADAIAADSPIRFDLLLRHEGVEKDVMVELVWDESAPGKDSVGNASDVSEPGADAIPAAVGTVHFPAGESVRSLVFQLEGLPAGLHQGQIRLAADDPLSDDNIRYFTLEAGETWHVLLVGKAPAAESTLFFREAISPEEFRTAGRAPFETNACDWQELERMSESDLANYAAICLFDPPGLAPDLIQRLSRYVELGGGLGLFPGANATPASAFQTPECEALLGCRLAVQVRVPDWDVTLVPVDLENGIMAPFRQFPDDIIPWSRMTVGRYWQLTDLSDRAQVVLKYSDGRPALLLAPFGRGTVVTGTTPLSEGPRSGAWNHFATGEASWLYLVLADAITRCLSAGQVAPLNYTAGELATLRPRVEAFPESVVLTMPDGERVSLQTHVETREVRFGGTHLPGSYRVRSSADGERAGLDCGFSVNVNADDFLPGTLGREEIDSCWPEGQASWLDNTNELQRHAGAARGSGELMPWLVVLLGLLLAGESVLSNRFYR